VTIVNFDDVIAAVKWGCICCWVQAVQVIRSLQKTNKELSTTSRLLQQRHDILRRRLREFCCLCLSVDCTQNASASHCKRQICITQVNPEKYFF